MNNSQEEQLTLFVADSPARTCPLPEKGRGLLESGVDYGSSLRELLTNLSRDGWLSKTSPVFYPLAVVPLAEPCEEYCESINILDVNARSMSAALSALPEGECLNLIKDATSQKSYLGWSNAGMAWPGGCLTLSMPEFHSAAVACSLSQVLETDVPQKYYLSAKAARGILRRAEKRGKELPDVLHSALETVAKVTE